MTHTLGPETGFSALGLAEALLRALALENYTDPTPIQRAAIPALLAGRDFLGLAQTGTGKTAAFALPLLQKLRTGHEGRRAKCVRALILAPTRELAIQIAESVRVYGRFLHLRHAVVVGGVSIGPQAKALAGGLDILVATPGRLLDHMNQGNVRLDAVETLILDEADRMFDMGFIRDIRKIVAVLPRKRQTMLFSATMPHDVERLAKDVLHQPLRVDIVPPKRTAEKIDQRVFHVPTSEKRALLARLLGDANLERVIVFTRTKHCANRVAEHLGKSGFSVDAIHGNKSQNARQRALTRFRSGEARILVATDIAARGIDVENVSHVINFELPNEPESYVHRIGRTARAGAGGVAISFCDASENAYLRDIERLTRGTITVAGGSIAPDAQPKPNHGSQTHRHHASPSRRRRGGARAGR
ncbi:MAG: DEAD/DEAH box helicase [Alphaproteobacteria bacterium]|nr:DEAD/DEAH box helicase [Alphaproteobacteria bacterium]